MKEEVYVRKTPLKQQDFQDTLYVLDDELRKWGVEIKKLPFFTCRHNWKRYLIIREYIGDEITRSYKRPKTIKFPKL